LLSDDLVAKLGNPLDALANYIMKRLAYAEGERDILIMHHEIGYKWANGQSEKKTVDFIQYGDIKGQTAMAKTVGLPAAITAKMVLESKCLRSRVLNPNYYSSQLTE
jgi:alpha-aminoadipic semialdehyde synthase